MKKPPADLLRQAERCPDALAVLMDWFLSECGDLPPGWVATPNGPVFVPPAQRTAPVKTRTRAGTWTRTGTRTRAGTWTGTRTRTRAGTWTGTWTVNPDNYTVEEMEVLSDRVGQPVVIEHGDRFYLARLEEVGMMEIEVFHLCEVRHTGRGGVFAAGHIEGLAEVEVGNVEMRHTFPRFGVRVGEWPGELPAESI